MNKIVFLLIMFLSFNIVPSFAYEAEIYEKDGCVYIVGHLTKEEKAEQGRVYKERMTERGKQINAEIQREHEIEIEQIKAQAMRDYLIAQSMPLREVAEAIEKMRIQHNVFVGDISASSTSFSEGVTVTNTNSAMGGTSTHNNY